MRASYLTGFCLLATVLGGHLGAQEVATPAPSSAEPSDSQSPSPGVPRVRPQRQPQHRTPQQMLDGAVHRLSQALDLDDKQQALLRSILESEREALIKLRSEPGSATDRVGAVHAIVDHTRERIQGILSDEQKKKYQKTVPANLTAPTQADTAHWLDLMQDAHPQSAKVAN